MGSVGKLALGTASFGNAYGEVRVDNAIEMVRHGLKNNISYFDTSPWYGQGRSEIILGKALAGVPRDSVFISTKVGRYSEDNIIEMFDFSQERVFKSVEESLKALGLDYVDALFAHDVEFASSIDMILGQTLPAMELVRQEGKARYLGVSGYQLSYLRDIIEASSVKCDFVLTYARYTLVDRELLHYLDFFKEKGVRVICGSPAGMGLLSNCGPPDWHPAGETLRNCCSKAASLFQDHNKNISTVSLKYALELPGVEFVLSGPTSILELEQNINACKEGLTLEERQLITLVDQQCFNSLSPDARNWEGVEVQKYKKKLQQALNITSIS